jgi:hypothetical protein
MAPRSLARGLAVAAFVAAQLAVAAAAFRWGWLLL